MQPSGELQQVPWLGQGVGRQSQPACKHMGRVPCPQPARTRLLTGPEVAAPGEWREGWDVTFLRLSQVHVIVARRGEMVWVRSGMERGAGELETEGQGHTGGGPELMGLHTRARQTGTESGFLYFG